MNKIYLILEVDNNIITMARVQAFESMIQKKKEYWKSWYALRNHDYKIYYDLASRMNDETFLINNYENRVHST